MRALLKHRHLAIAVVALNWACSSGPINPPPPPPGLTLNIGSVSISPPTGATLAPTQTAQLTATAKDPAGNTLTMVNFSWTTSAGAVAAVSTNGLVTANSAGTAVITATAQGKSAEVSITVR